MIRWKSFLARAGVASLMVGAVVFCAVFVAMRLAGADPGGPTRNDLTFAGVLPDRPNRSDTMLTFVFRKGGSPTATCTTTTARFLTDSTGAFSVPIPLAGAGCPDPRGLFDGDNVVYDVLLGDASSTDVIARNVDITPVPHARFADQVGVSTDCPVGYVSEPSAAGFGSDTHLCKRYRPAPDGGAPISYDEVVRVGSGPSSFWIDRFEATVSQNVDGTGSRYGFSEGDFPSTFPQNGQVVTPVFARSRTAVPGETQIGPSRFITWFQANEACAASGKRLPTGAEWLLAARGTPDAGCHHSSENTAARPRAVDVSTCRSFWGAQDMIGNVAEWTAEWSGAPGDAGSNGSASSWPRTAYGQDQAFNVGGSVFETQPDGVRNAGLPPAAVRGGSWRNVGAGTGIFVFDLRNAPSVSSEEIGFRCVVPR